MVYGLIVSVIVLIFLFFVFSRKQKESVAVALDEELPTNRRENFRLKFNNSYCNFHPLVTSIKQLGSIQDLSPSGIRIETSTDELSRGSLLMLYFEINDETFIFEGIVKRKRSLAPNLNQYGIKFINSTVSQRDRLYRILRTVERQRSNAQ